MLQSICPSVRLSVQYKRRVLLQKGQIVRFGSSPRCNGQAVLGQIDEV